MKPYRHQLRAATFLSSSLRALLWGDPGTGKTGAALLALERLEPGPPALVISPLSTLIHWQREAARFTGLAGSVVRTAADLDKPADLYIINPDRLYNEKIFARLKARRWSALILDESQMFKNPDAKRTKRALGRGGLVHQAARTWLLSGTPCPQGPVDLWVPLRVLWPDLVAGMSRDGFIEHYHVLADDKIKIVAVRPDRVAELRQRLGPYLLRQPIELCDLPPLTFAEEPISPEDLHLSREALQRAEQAAHMDGWRGLSDDALLEMIKRSMLVLPTLRALLAEAKTSAVLAQAADELFGDPVKKLVVFSCHLAPLFKLAAALVPFNPAVLTGSVSPAERQRGIDRFQSDPACRLFLAQVQAGGMGITLHAASECWFVDAPWTPTDLVQAAKRLHRIGQTRPVVARLFTVADTVDDAVTSTIARKARAITSFEPTASERIFA